MRIVLSLLTLVGLLILVGCGAIPREGLRLWQLHECDPADFDQRQVTLATLGDVEVHLPAIGASRCDVLTGLGVPSQRSITASGVEIWEYPQHRTSVLFVKGHVAEVVALRVQ